MLYACWSVKGGSGTTVVAAGLALALAEQQARRRVVAGVDHRLDHQGDVLLADLAGDLPAALGLAEPAGPGLVEWLAAADDLPADALVRLEVPLASQVSLVRRGDGPWHSAAPETLPVALSSGGRTVVADCGTLPLESPAEVPLAVTAMAARSVLVVRPCYLALRRAQQSPVRPWKVVVVSEPGRALDARDVESVLGVPLLAEVAVDPAVARAVDAGVLASRPPRSLARTLGRALEAAPSPAPGAGR